MKKAMIAVLLIAAASQSSPALAQAEDAAPPPAVVAYSAEASEAQAEAALRGMVDWLAEDFDAARAIALQWATNDALPPDFRRRILQDTIIAARRIRQFDIEPEAGEAYRQLVEILPPGLARADLHRGYANLNLWRGRFETAESLFRTTIEESAVEDPGLRADLNNSLAVTLAQQGKLDQALEVFLEAYRLFEQTEEGPSAVLLRNIGGLYQYLEEWEKSESFSRLALAKSEPDSPSLPGLYSNLAGALIEQGKLEEALEALQTGLALSEAQGLPSSSALNNLGFVLRELGRPEEALARFERAADIDRAAGDLSSLAIGTKNIGETLIQLGRREAAAEVLEQSLALYREGDIKPKRLELYPVMIENLEQLDRYPEALAMMREQFALQQEIDSSDAQARVAELQTAFDLERRERELAESERERLAGEARLSNLEAAQTRQRHLRTLLITGVVGLALILLLLLRLLQLRNRANRLLAEKNAQIDAQHRKLGETNERLQRQSLQDDLTGLGNRRFVRRLLESDLPEALTQSDALLLIIDLDRFKGINDQFGHPVGDQVLIDFAETFRQIAGADDVLARWGGEEFLWLVAGADLNAASSLYRTFGKALRETDFRVGSRNLSITCSIGAAALTLGKTTPQEDFDRALKIADAALYEAKAAGRNSGQGFDVGTDDLKVFEGRLDIQALVERDALIRRTL